MHRLRSQRGWDIAFKNLGHRQNPGAVQIALHREIHHGAIGTARQYDRAFQRQRQHFFQHANLFFQIGKSLAQLGAVRHPHLPFAVVAQAGGFENARQQIRRRRLHVRPSGDIDKGCAWDAAAHEVGFFGQPVLGNRYRLGARCHGARGGEGSERIGGHVFKFGGDGAAQRSQLRQALRVLVGTLDVVVADAPGGAVGVRV